MHCHGPRLLALLCSLPLVAGAETLAPAPTDAQASRFLELNTRRRAVRPDGGEQIENKTVLWDASKTAMVLCDLWDKHWCSGASKRVAEMAPRINEVVKAARSRGVLIIHAPSDTMSFYEGTPERRLAQSAPPVEPRVPLQRWCGLDKEREGKLPIDDSDGGCDDQPRCVEERPWTRQIPAIEVVPGDAVTDSSEAYYLMRQRGIENVIILGVHTNMCVLGRPFSIRQLSYQGLNVVLMRDLTDTMYNSRMEPRVSHFDGTRLVVGHIEKFWCPTITSVDLVGGTPFRFSEDPSPESVQAN